MKIIDNFLETLLIPPLNSIISFSSCHDNPERYILADDLPNLGKPCFFYIGKMNISLEVGWLDFQIEGFIQIINKTMNKMKRRFVAFMNQRIVAIDLFNLRIIL